MREGCSGGPQRAAGTGAGWAWAWPEVSVNGSSDSQHMLCPQMTTLKGLPGVRVVTSLSEVAGERLTFNLSTLFHVNPCYLLARGLASCFTRISSAAF